MHYLALITIHNIMSTFNAIEAKATREKEM